MVCSYPFVQNSCRADSRTSSGLNAFDLAITVHLPLLIDYNMVSNIDQINNFAAALFAVRRNC